MTKAPVAIMIPTKDEQENLPYALASVADWAAQVFVLDSGSADRTEAIARERGAQFVVHAWEGYARQKNWGLDNLPITTPWVFILDADEAITPKLRDELIAVATADSCPENAFYVNRYFVFLGQRIRHCGYYPSWNLRFFRRGKARYEQRDVHEHMVVDGSSGYLKHDMEHYDRRGLELYIAKHNHYSTLEARELYRIERNRSQGTMKFSFWGGPIERRRWVKHVIWPRLPAKWLFRWLFMYIFKLGILDGVIGFHFCLFLASYEHQITLKLKELRLAEKQQTENPHPHPPPEYRGREGREQSPQPTTGGHA
jgi:glycosyltransferase involved in cell wall biosynthesis